MLGRQHLTLLLAASTALVGGCMRAVPVDEPALTPADQEVCAQVMADLPATVLDAERRATDPGVVSAAWGSPPVTLRCGVPQPTTMTATSECLEVNGVGWYAEPGTGGVVFTTLGRDTFIEVAVPSRYAPEPAALTFFSATVDRHDPLRTPCV